MSQIDAAFVAACVANFPENQTFWRKAQQGQFVLPHCQACGKTHWFPRAFCPMCFSDDISWEDSAGHGKVYSYSRLQGDSGERVIAYVQLDEGPLMLTELVDVGPDLAIGQPVCARMVEVAPQLRIPKFSPRH